MKFQIVTTLKLTAVAALAAAGTAHAAFVVSVENAGVYNSTSTFSTVGIETFDTSSSGSFATSYGLTGLSGSYSGVSVLNADQYGGAGGTGRYAQAFNPAGYTLSLSGTTSVNYFGFYLSALDAGNTVNFMKNGATVYSFTPTMVVAALSSGSGQYYGNPSASFLGQNSSQPYVFVNFYDVGDTFDSIQFSENLAGAGYESDNHTVGVFTSMTGTPVSAVPEPETYALMLAGLGLVGLVARRRKTASAAA